MNALKAKNNEPPKQFYAENGAQPTMVSESLELASVLLPKQPPIPFSPNKFLFYCFLLIRSWRICCHKGTIPSQHNYIHGPVLYHIKMPHNRTVFF